MKKKLIALLLSCGLLFSAAPAFADGWVGNSYIYEQPVPLTIHIDGKYLPCDVDPIIKDSRTLLPLRAAAESLGAEVDWNQSTQTASLSKDGNSINFTLNQHTYTVNNQPKPLDVAPQIVNNRTMIPLRAFAEALGTKVEWNHALQDVSIRTNDQELSIPTLPEGVTQDAKRFIYKYQVNSDPTDPYVGSWTYDDSYESGKDKTDYKIYNFISKTDTGYQSINMTVEYTTLCSIPIITISKNGGWIENNSLHISYEPNIIYYKGNARGWTADGYNVYNMIDNHLVRTMMVDTFHAHNEYQRYDIHSRF